MDKAFGFYPMRMWVRILLAVRFLKKMDVIKMLDTEILYIVEVIKYFLNRFNVYLEKVFDKA